MGIGRRQMSNSTFRRRSRHITNMTFCERHHDVNRSPETSSATVKFNTVKFRRNGDNTATNLSR